MSTLFELNEHLRRVVALNFPQPLWIAAEIAQINESKGHFYLELVQKDEQEIIAQAQAVLWAADFRQIMRRLGQAFLSVWREGLEVKLQVRPDFHERYGFKLQIVDIDLSFTLGQLDLQRRQTIQALQAQGLFDRNRQLLLPRVVQRIALISSESAAGRQDFVRQLVDNRFGYQFQLTFFHAAVQGKDAGPDIINALDNIAARCSDVDAVVLVRGGGSRLDLSAFDDFELCARVADMPLPVLVGIGHDVDETVLDLVACRSLKTPTAVAEYCIQHNLAFEAGVLETQEFIRRQATAMLYEETRQLERCLSEWRWSAKQMLQAAAFQVQMAVEQSPLLARQALRRHQLAVQQAEAFCLALHPERVLQRGFSLTLSNGRVVVDAASLKAGDLLETHFKTGKITSEVQ